jgi:hypothetical protein
MCRVNGPYLDFWHMVFAIDVGARENRRCQLAQGCQGGDQIDGADGMDALGDRE